MDQTTGGGFSDEIAVRIDLDSTNPIESQRDPAGIGARRNDEVVFQFV